MRERDSFDKRRTRYVRAPKLEDRVIPREPERKKKRSSLIAELARGGVNTLSAGAVALNMGMSDIAKRLVDATSSQQQLADVLLRGEPKPEIKSAIEVDRKMRQEVLDDMISKAREQLEEAPVRDALKNGGKGAADLIIPPVEYPMSEKLLEGTTYDVSELHRKYPVLIHVPPGGNPPTPYSSHTLAKAERPDGGYANGFYYGDEHTILTVGHLIEYLNKEANKQRISYTFDAAYVNVPDQYASTSSEFVVADTGLPSREDIHGRLMSIVGIDPDMTSNEAGRKTYTGVAFCPDKKALAAIVPYYFNDSNSNVYRNSAELSCMVVIPAGENLLDEKGKSMRIKGMSGSPAFAYINGAYETAGLVWAVATISLTTKNVFVAMVLPIKEVDERLVGSRVWPLNEKEGESY